VHAHGTEDPVDYGKDIDRNVRRQKRYLQCHPPGLRAWQGGGGRVREADVMSCKRDEAHGYHVDHANSSDDRIPTHPYILVCVCVCLGIRLRCCI